ncbi:MAG TPA: DUF1080 domain-containing protein [Thermoguttaceae bacterium]|nr:DUF1080 domain-containing protein [Thermoguttaceae bacterium]
MNSSVRVRLGLMAAIPLAVIFSAWLLLDSTRVYPPAAGAAEAAKVPQADNGLCYVCHLTLAEEEITTSHLAEGHGCVKCHGVSRDHMHDEMLMTTPDRLYGRRQVDAMCGECHEEPHEDVETQVSDFLEQWRDKERPNGRAVTETSICTDCHGTHNIDKDLKAESHREPEWTAAFNGQDLSGWRPAGKAKWEIRLGRIVATAAADGPGDLWSETRYENYLLAVTFRGDWPLYAGIWLRAADAAEGPRVEIFQRDKPAAFTGSVGLPGRGLALVNLREDLFDAGGWNTLSIEVRGNRIAVWLNAAEVGAVCLDMPEKGRIGLHIQGGPAYQDAQLTIGEIQIQELSGVGESPQ